MKYMLLSTANKPDRANRRQIEPMTPFENDRRALLRGVIMMMEMC